MPSLPDHNVFIFAHQDDEVAGASRILYELGRGALVSCIFLTDGRLGRATPATRDRESLAALTSLGVAPGRIAFLGSQLPIPDGALVDHLDLALDGLERWCANQTVTAIYCLAWEGGHHDHDASHLVAAAFAARRGLLGSCFEVPLYRASRFTAAFRVLAPVGPSREWQRRKLTLREGLRATLLVRRYPSQWRSWLGLFPELLLKLVVLRREILRPVAAKRLRTRPHPVLLYERRFGVPHSRFTSAAEKFLANHFPAGEELRR